MKIKKRYKQLVETLQIEFEYTVSRKAKIINALLWGLKVFFILFILRPFGISDESFFIFFYTCTGYGAITFLVFYINNISTKGYIFNALNKKWHVSNELIYVFVVFPQIAFLNYMFYIFLDYKEFFSVTGLFKISFYTFDLIIILALIRIIYKLVNSFKKESVILKTKNEYYIEINKLKNIIDASKEEILLNFENGQIRLQRDSILMINAWGNYIKIYIKVNNEVVQIVRRGKLKNTVKELMKYVEFFHCHRSFIINMNFVKTISGNNKSAEAIFKTGNLKASISRENIKIVRTLFENLQQQTISFSIS